MSPQPYNEQEPILTDEIRAALKPEFDAIEKKAYDLGFRDARRETAAKAKKTPAELSQRAIELREAAAKRGESMTNIESVQAACKEAGVPF
jgi:hypothetical protein